MKIMKTRKKHKCLRKLLVYVCVFVYLIPFRFFCFFFKRIASYKRCLRLKLEVPCCCNGIFHSLFELMCVLTNYVIFQALPSPEYGNYCYFCDSILLLL